MNDPNFAHRASSLVAPGPSRLGARAVAFSLAILSIAACSSSGGDEGTAATPDSGSTGNTDAGTTTGPDTGTGNDIDASTPGNDSGVTPGTDAGPGVDAAKACADAASAVCAKLATCSSFVVSVTYGDVAKCKERFLVSCASAFTAPGTSTTPAKTEACAKSIAQVSCGDVLSGNLGAACNPSPGSLAAGAACRDDAQCASTFCARAPDTECGTCAALTSAGSPCVNQACSRGTTCPKGGTTCVAPVAGKVGDACTSQEQCDLANAVGCNTNSKKCITLAVANSGQTCGSNIAQDKFTVCSAAGACSAVLGGMCSAAAADGATCSTADTGPHCMTPAVCTGGKCKVPDATACH